MKIRALCVLSCLAVSLVPLAALAQTGLGPQITKGSITVPGKDLVFDGPLTSALGPLGGFQIEVKLPQKGIIASGCAQDDGLAIQMGDVDPKGAQLDVPIDPILAKKKQDYYNKLLQMSADNKDVTLKIQGPKVFLTHKDGELYAPDCLVSFDGFGQ